MASVRSALSSLPRALLPGPSSSRLVVASASTFATTASTTPEAARMIDFPTLKPLKPTHGVHVATLHLRAHHPIPLDLYTNFALHSARSLEIPTSGAAFLPSSRELYTVIKSPFVHKKAQENFERRTLRRAIKVFDAERDVIDLWLRYLKRNGIGGVSIKAIVYEWVDYGFGRKEIEAVEGMMQGGDQDKVEKAAQELIKSLGGLEFAEVSEGKGEITAEAAAEMESSSEAEIAAEVTEAGVESVDTQAETPKSAA